MTDPDGSMFDPPPPIITQYDLIETDTPVDPSGTATVIQAKLETPTVTIMSDTGTIIALDPAVLPGQSFHRDVPDATTDLSGSITLTRVVDPMLSSDGAV